MTQLSRKKCVLKSSFECCQLTFWVEPSNQRNRHQVRKAIVPLFEISLSFMKHLPKSLTKYSLPSCWPSCLSHHLHIISAKRERSVFFYALFFFLNTSLLVKPPMTAARDNISLSQTWSCCVCCCFLASEQRWMQTMTSLCQRKKGRYLSEWQD